MRARIDVRMVAAAIAVMGWAPRLVAQAAPQVSVKAEGPVSSTGRLQALVQAHDSAHVLVLHVAPDGYVSVVWPAKPTDDDRVAKGASLLTATTFVGFNEQLDVQRTLRLVPIVPAARRASYDARGGYLVAVSSAQPLQLDSLRSGDKWGSWTLDNFQASADPTKLIDQFATYFTNDATPHAVSYASSALYAYLRPAALDRPVYVVRVVRQ
ncbi:MAG: hypothetical protein JWO05_3269 [Gemmatimonadetes bacterium]|nr:hypothetical protein [Gemmatimonadota bacterium]